MSIPGMYTPAQRQRPIIPPFTPSENVENNVEMLSVSTVLVAIGATVLVAIGTAESNRQPKTATRKPFVRALFFLGSSAA